MFRRAWHVDDSKGLWLSFTCLRTASNEHSHLDPSKLGTAHWGDLIVEGSAFASYGALSTSNTINALEFADVNVSEQLVWHSIAYIAADAASLVGLRVWQLLLKSARGAMMSC